MFFKAMIVAVVAVVSVPVGSPEKAENPSVDFTSVQIVEEKDHSTFSKVGKEYCKETIDFRVATRGCKDIDKIGDIEFSMPDIKGIQK